MSEPMIAFRDVTKTFGSGTRACTALDGITLDIGPGEVHAVVGRSGAGKSTLVRTINGLTHIDSGRVEVAGDLISQAGPAALRAKRRSIGMIFQHFNLHDRRTVARNIAFPLEIHRVPAAQIRERVDRVIDLVGLRDRADHHPAQLSGGQKQRVGIARALVTEPDILLSDEATSALDSETTGQILALLGDIRDRLGLTTVLITHELEVVRSLASHATLLEAGRIVDSGAVPDLVLDPESKLGEALFTSRLDAPDPDSPPLLVVTFVGNLSQLPYWSLLAREFDVEVTIVSVHADRIAETWYSRFHLRFTAPDGTPAELEPIAAWLREREVDVHVH